ncbi:MAG: membrane dipeptidase [Gemmatimonadota bacterium]
MPEISLEEAQAVHQRALVFDGHNDTPVERVARGEDPFRWLERDPAYNVDVPRMREGGYGGGFFIVGNGPTANLWATLERTLAQLDRHPDVFRQVRTSSDVTAARQAGQIAVLLAIEGAGRWLEGRLETLRLLYRLGLRSLGLSHGEGGDEPHQLQGSPSAFDFCTAADRERARSQLHGLTSFGAAVLELSNELGVITDLAHINDRAFYEVLERSRLPVTMSHTAAFAQCPHWRCLTDDQIRALAQSGGVMGIAFAPMFIDRTAPTADRIVDHICHVADLVGIEHVAIGADYDGLGSLTPVIPEVSQLPLLTRAMLARGLTEAEVVQVWGGNFLRLLRATIDPSR